MSIVPADLPRDAGLPTVVCARQADQGLDRLLSHVLAARGVMRAELRNQPPNTQRPVIVRGRLLQSLEAYAAALTTRGLFAPPSLRDELALQRGLATSR